jgi:hypothetical protein
MRFDTDLNHASAIWGCKNGHSGAMNARIATVFACKRPPPANPKKPYQNWHTAVFSITIPV